MWKKQLSKEQLLAPMRVEALVAGEKDENRAYTDAAANFRMLEYTSLAKQMQTSPFTYTDPLQKGVHLHWILPEAFTHGIQDGELAEVIYPEVPDTWLVIRIAVKTRGLLEPKIETRAFLVESRYISQTKQGENQDSQPYPVQDANGRMTYVYLGRSMDLQSLQKPGNYLDSMKAFGYGDPSFFAYYQSCRNVFGFYDNLEDMDEGELTYQICGWFGNEEQDPLKEEDQLFQTLREFQWKLKKGGSGERRARRVLCHGNIHGIQWKGPDVTYDSGIFTETPAMALGNNSNEALCAMLMQKAKAGVMGERLLYGFLNGTAEELEEQDGLIKAEQTIHENMFDPEEGERQWLLKEREHDKKETGAPDLSWETACMLQELNKGEKSLERFKQARKRLEKEIYFLWYEYTAKIRTEKAPKEEREAYLKELSAHMKAFKKLYLQIKAQEKKVEEYKAKLENQEEVKAHYQLIACPGERYYLPTEPVLLFMGKGISNLFGEKERLEDRGGEERLLCRTYAQVTEGIEIPEEGRKLSMEAYGSRILGWYGYPPVIRKLLGETLLMIPALAESLARQLLISRAGVSEPGELKAVTKAIRALQEELLDGKKAEGSDQEASDLKITVQGLLPAPAVFSRYEACYHPLFMDWGIFYHPDEDCLGGHSHLKKWRLDKVDYELTEDVAYNRKSGKYKGKMALTGHATENIRAVLERYLQKEKEQEAGNGSEKRLEHLKERLLGMEILSQRLNGFQEYFLREKQAMHLPFAILWEEDEGIQQVMDQVLTQNQKAQFYKHLDETIMTDPYMEGVYSPVRAGFLEMAEIRLVDSFGRVKTVCSEEEHELEAKAMAFSENFRKEGEETKIVLPPRLMLPARLKTSFESVRDRQVEAGDAKCTTPIFGWLIPGYMDGSLSVVDAKGRLLGKYQTFLNRKGQSVIRFVNSAQKDSPKENGRFELPKDVHGELRKFMAGFLEAMREGVKKDPDILGDLVNHLCYDLGNMKQHRGISGGAPWVMGQPLALANMTLCLETKEFPGKRPDWNREEEQPSPLKALSFPAYIGDKRRRDDGLAGFFTENENGYYGQIFMEKPESFDLGAYICGENKLEISWNQEKRITLLFDPLLPVHIITGILPVKTTQISRQVAESALIQIQPQLFLHPALTGKKGLKIPLPQIQGKTWEYMTLREGIYTGGNSIGNQGMDTLALDYPLSLTEGWLQQREEEREYGV